MPNYRRNYVPGGTYFFTLVTHERRPILTTDLGRVGLRRAIRAVRRRWPFAVLGIVLMPDHLHTVWTLPPGDARYSNRLRRIKRLFTNAFLAGGGTEGERSASRRRRSERGVWQRRFWEHTVRDGDDLIRCMDYLHFNPVKHGLAANVRDWSWSSFHRYVESGDYPPDWGSGPPADLPGAEWDKPGAR